MAGDYEVPSTSNYMKFEEGENRFRILGSFGEKTAIMGTEYWKTTDDNKRIPVRIKLGESVPVGDLGINNFGEPEMPKHFWALPVYNYKEKRIQILEITQKSILQAITALAKNKKWGNPKDYDLVVTRVDEKKISYSVTPDPKEKLEEGILKMYKEMNININALFTGDDPFSANKGEKMNENVDPDDVKI